MSILRLWRRCWSVSSDRRALVVEAAFWLTVARVAILCFRFPWIARCVGRLHAPHAATTSECAPAAAAEVAWAIERAALALPIQVVCLPRALAAWQMLHRRAIPAKLHFGASRKIVSRNATSDNVASDSANAQRLLTHAWVDAGGVEVAGYPEAYDCVEIAFFA